MSDYGDAKELQDAFFGPVRWLTEMGVNGDERSIKSLGAIALLLDGWRPSDPDPRFDPDPEVEETDVIDISEWRSRLAA